MASHLERPPSEPLILKISDYLKSKTERRRVEESSSLVAGIHKLKISRRFAKKSVTSLQQGRILLTKWANGECQRNSAISDVMFQALELFKMDADDELNFLANSDDFIEGLSKVSDVERKYVAPWNRLSKKFRATKSKLRAKVDNKQRRFSGGSKMQLKLEKQEVSEYEFAKQTAERQLSEAEAVKMLFFRQTMTNFANAFRSRADNLQKISNAFIQLSKCVPEITTEDITKMEYKGKPYTREIISALRTSLGESNSNEIGGSNKSAFENFSPLITPITNYDAQNHLKGRRVHFDNWGQKHRSSGDKNQCEFPYSNQTELDTFDELLKLLEEPAPLYEQIQVNMPPPPYSGHERKRKVKDTEFRQPTAPFMTPPPSAQKSAQPSTTNESGIYYSKPIDQQEKGASPSSYLSPVRCLDNSQEPKTNDHDQKPVPKKDKNQTVVNRSNQNNYYALGSVIPTGRKSNLGNGINLQPKDSQQNECFSLYPTLPLLRP